MNKNSLSLGSRRIALAIAACGFMVSSANAQVDVTATGGTTTGTYTTLSAAFAAVNAGTHTGTIDIAITGDVEEPASVTPLLKSASPSSYTSVYIHPSGGNWTISSPTIPAGNRGLIELQGADNVTIDGDDPATTGARNLTIETATADVFNVACIRLSSNSVTGDDGADNDTIRNCIIIGSRSSADNTYTNYGINMSHYQTNSMGAGAFNSMNTVIENNEIKRAYYGIYANAYGNYSGTMYTLPGLIIRNNIIGSSTAADNIGKVGIYLYGTSTDGTNPALVEGNDISVGYGSTTGAGYATTIYGVQVGDGNAKCMVRNNNIHDILQPNTATYIGQDGIYVSSNSDSIRIINNMIRDVVGAKSTTSFTSSFGTFGIQVSLSPTNMVIDHNTIALLQTQSTGSAQDPVSACLSFISANATAVASLQNNIFVNNNASTRAVGVATYGTNGNISAATVNNNDYYTPSGATGYYNNALQVALTDWQTATGKDANALNVQPAFVSATDLHIDNSVPSELESAGSVTSTTTDIDGDARPGPAGSVNGGGTAPDIGADEFDGIPATPMAIHLTKISATNFGSRNQVNWTNPDESSTAKYIIERSADAKSFTSIGNQLSAGKSAYNFWDESPLPGKNYYRLKMVEINGEVTYSTVVTAQLATGNNFELNVHPNPATNLIQIETNGDAGAQVQIINLTGKVVKTIMLHHASESINISNLPTGAYWLKYSDAGRQEIRKFIKH